MGTAWTYAKDVAQDHVAIRTKAGLMDVSGLKKLHIVGPHAAAVLNYTTTRDVAKIYPGKSAYACMLNEAGHFIEDCILYRTAPNAWMVVHGSGAGHETLTAHVVGRNAALIVDEDLHDLSLQGPLAVDFLAKHVPGIRDLKYFHHLPTTLFGRPVLISRTGSNWRVKVTPKVTMTPMVFSSQRLSTSSGVNRRRSPSMGTSRISTSK